MSSPTEQPVEDAAVNCFGAMGAASKRGVEVEYRDPKTGETCCGCARLRDTEVRATRTP